VIDVVGARQQTLPARRDPVSWCSLPGWPAGGALVPRLWSAESPVRIPLRVLLAPTSPDVNTELRLEAYDHPPAPLSGLLDGRQRGRLAGHHPQPDASTSWSALFPRPTGCHGNCCTCFRYHCCCRGRTGRWAAALTGGKAVRPRGKRVPFLPNPGLFVCGVCDLSGKPLSPPLLPGARCAEATVDLNRQPVSHLSGGECWTIRAYAHDGLGNSGSVGTRAPSRHAYPAQRTDPARSQLSAGLHSALIVVAICFSPSWRSGDRRPRRPAGEDTIAIGS